MTASAARDPGWIARVRAADIPIELFDAETDDDYSIAWLEATILSAARQRSLSDDDLYPLLVRVWTGSYAAIDWPSEAPQIARRCATALAAEQPCELGALHLPTDQSIQTAHEAIVKDLGLTPADLLEVLADNWQHAEHLECRLDRRRTLLEFAGHVLIGPIAAACTLIWAALNPREGRFEARRRPQPNGWSPVAADAWTDVVHAELAVLGQPARDVPEDGDEAALLLAYARANVLRDLGGEGAVAASIVRTECSQGATDLVDALALGAVQFALERRDDIDVDTENEEIVDAIQHRIMAADDELVSWMRDPAFATLIDPVGSARTGGDLLLEDADWLTWSLTWAAVEAVRATLLAPARSD